ncbi:phosphopantetheine-binding protein [Streptomyces anulatus]|uniref:phosphopantetheine-binding protein n=1 Tax=Streptomyces anulatus TaxID=1892 RepID=UPI00340A0434|nr:phosphopantetheine-binding protein [Streptomyces anulatus]WSU87997.1 phosphopantetheine-binding protein [Streptomyces anulatus]
MPMTTKGKVVDTALPDPSSSRPEPSRSYIAPDSAAERRVARVWQQRLTLDRVGVHDNFCDSGGNSIRLPAVLAALQKHPEYQDLITLTDLFRHPPAAAVAARLDQTAEQEAARRGGDRRAAPHKLRSRKGTTR